MEKNLPMNAVIDLWIKYKQNTVKLSTWTYYRRVSNKILKIEWGKYMSFDITNNAIENLSKNLSSTYSSKTVRDIIGIANQILIFSYEQGYLQCNYLKRVKIPLKKKSPEILSLAEQKAFTSFLLNNPDSSKIGVLLSLYTGLRLGELCGLQWKDVDLKKRTLCINKTIQRIEDENGTTFLLIDSPKTISSERVIPIPNFLIPLLYGIKTKNESDYVSTGKPTFTQPRTYQSRLKSYLKKCELPDYHFHTLRHTFASRAIELGFDPKSLSEILGHSSVKITLDLYVHPSMEAKKEQMDLFKNLI